MSKNKIIKEVEDIVNQANDKYCKFTGRHDNIKQINDILTEHTIIENLIDIKEFDKDLFLHSVNTAIISLSMGANMKLNNDELYKLAVGALLHDIGKLFIPENILKKPSKLSELEYNVIKEHTTLGYQYMEYKNIPLESKLIILEHHERPDGKGYPNNNKKINKLSGIVSVADAYEAMTSKRVYNSKMSSKKAIAIILENKNKQFEETIAINFHSTTIAFT